MSETTEKLNGYISRTEAIRRYGARGVTRSRLDYLVRMGVLEYMPGTCNMLKEEDVQRIADEGEVQGQVRAGHKLGKPRRTRKCTYLRKEHIHAAYKALGICAQLATRSDAIKARLGDPVKLMEYADVFSKKYKELNNGSQEQSK